MKKLRGEIMRRHRGQEREKRGERGQRIKSEMETVESDLKVQSKRTGDESLSTEKEEWAAEVTLTV